MTSRVPIQRVLDDRSLVDDVAVTSDGSLGWLADDVGESQATCGQTDGLDWACEYRLVVVSRCSGVSNSLFGDKFLAFFLVIACDTELNRRQCFNS